MSRLFPALMSTMSGEVMMTSPLVSVERVRLPLVADMFELPVPSMEKAPVESMS